MASKSLPSHDTPLLPPKGTYARPRPTDLRSPCPAINVCANHGYIPRDGRNVRANDLYAALDAFGLSALVASGFAYPPYTQLPAGSHPKPTPAWSFLSSGFFNWAFGSFAMRPQGQADKEGYAVLNLNQMGRPDVVEHDISLSRLDHQQGDNITPRKDLIKQILSASSDGETINVDDFAELRKARIQQQRRDNPANNYGSAQHRIACAEISLILKVLGDGVQVPVSYVKAFFEEERLPIEEGWTKRSWYNTLGLFELSRCVMKVQGAIGDFSEKILPPLATNY